MNKNAYTGIADNYGQPHALLRSQPDQDKIQDEPYMKLVLENNPTLRAAREAYQVALLRAGTGNTPPNPEVEFGYLFRQSRRDGEPY